jgi:hypothetical protein
MMDIEEIKWRLHRANLKQNAAQDFWQGCFSQFTAALKVGTPHEIEQARAGLVSAYEAYVDAFKISMEWALRLTNEGYDKGYA